MTTSTRLVLCLFRQSSTAAVSATCRFAVLTHDCPQDCPSRAPLASQYSSRLQAHSAFRSGLRTHYFRNTRQFLPDWTRPPPQTLKMALLDTGHTMIHATRPSRCLFRRQPVAGALPVPVPAYIQSDSVPSHSVTVQRSISLSSVAWRSSAFTVSKICLATLNGTAKRPHKTWTPDELRPGHLR